MDILDNLLVKDDVIQVTQLSVILVLSSCVFGKKKFSIEFQFVTTFLIALTIYG